MDGYNKNAHGGEFVTYERLSAMGNNGFQEPATGFAEGKIEGTQRLYTDGVFSTDNGRAQFMDAPWRGLQAPGKQQQKDNHRYLINNGRANVVWQSAYLDQENDFVMDRFPYPFIEMNPEDMAEAGLKEGDLVEFTMMPVRLRPWPIRRRQQGAGKPSCSSAFRPACRAMSPVPGQMNSSFRTTSRPGATFARFRTRPAM
ncbi:hypothetical protein HNR26_004688 [Rhizobium rosettiformans]|uniref:Molybdopterin dinucleotide-binding domain-containing protein n=1 Tax=Rhizobium rosettiformans TaxID=1368430 RepID=A0A7W8HUZ0_9HYPH|nr:hypothetical protein [Rhizobium rosettiformans]